MTSLRQFKCGNCRGYQGQKHHVWHERVPDANPKSQCHSCKKMRNPVPTGEEEGVKICHFACSCENEYVVRCEMSDTAPCYKCHSKQVSPHSFEKLRKINRQSDNSHNCSKCDGKMNCPNMREQPPKASDSESGGCIDPNREKHPRGWRHVQEARYKSQCTVISIYLQEKDTRYIIIIIYLYCTNCIPCHCFIQ